jgi:hypothetical protein
MSGHGLTCSKIDVTIISQQIIEAISRRLLIYVHVRTAQTADAHQSPSVVLYLLNYYKEERETICFHLFLARHNNFNKH